MIETTATIALIAMALTTYFTRVSGALIMSRVPLSPAVRRFLRAVSGSVLVALVVPPTLNGDIATQAAVGAAVILMIVVRNASLAILIGIIAAVIVRQIGL